MKAILTIPRFAGVMCFYFLEAAEEWLGREVEADESGMTGFRGFWGSGLDYVTD